MRKFEDYSKAYQTLKMERDGDGILLLTAHTDGGPLRWGALPHEEWPHAFHDIAMDRDNRVVILTGTGDEFSGPRPPAATRYARPVADMDRIVFDGRHLLANLLEIQAPMISAINGPCIRHSEFRCCQISCSLRTRPSSRMQDISTAVSFPAMGST